MPDHPSAGDTLARLRRTFDQGSTRPLAWRRAQLEALAHLLADGEAELLEALAADMGKPSVEARLTDLSVVAAEIPVLVRNLDRWARPERARVPIAQLPATAKVVREPLGVVLVIAPWNYPVQLLLLPLASALAAGNCVVAKPSELAPRTSAALARLLRAYLDPTAVAVVEGGPTETEELLSHRFDSIFFTGSARIGQLVMAAAARHLTPVTLELGGKCPVIVAADADLKAAARRISWGKFVNAGQTCVAPDYLLVERSRRDELVERIASTVQAFYRPDPRRSPDYARIVNDHHFDRLDALIADTKGRVVVGGETERAERFVAPTVVVDVAANDPLMEDELFGPLLPVVTVDDIGEAVKFVASCPKPLALYLFSGSAAVVQRVTNETSSGGLGVNCTLQHLAVPELPFGGVGASGFGAYHGWYGFETFSHRKAVLTKPARPDLPVIYPPYSRLKERLLRRIV